MSRPLSLAAQAVLDRVAGECDVRFIAAAALRALADQAGCAKHWHVDQLRAIAAELEGGAITTTTPQEAQ